MRVGDAVRAHEQRTSPALPPVPVRAWAHGTTTEPWDHALARTTGAVQVGSSQAARALMRCPASGASGLPFFRAALAQLVAQHLSAQGLAAMRQRERFAAQARLAARGDDAETARKRAYAALSRIRFDGMQVRSDIAAT